MSTLTLRPHHPSRRHVLLLVATVALSAPLAAQPPEAFDDEKRVTAIDLLVSFEAGAMREWAKDGPVPKTLRPEDFEVLYDGEPRPVVAVDATQGAWQTVIYFDTVLAGTTDLRWSATVLADEIEALTALGQVTVIVADPAPRTLLSASRDTDRLHSMLAQQAQTIEGVDEIQALRMEVVDELQREDSELDAEVLREIAAGEARRVRERQNDLLLTLAEHDTAGAHRALIFAGHRFDLRPEDFYEPLIAQLDGSSQVPGTPSGSGPSGSGPSGSGTPSGASPQKVPGTPSEGLAEKVPGTVSEADFYESLIALRQHIAQDVPGTPPSTPGTLSSETLTASTETLARTLAAYGWVSLPLAPPAPKPLKPGKRIGKFRLSGPGIVYDEDENRTFFKFFSATFEENRKPLRAEAYLELGAALEGQGKLAEAEEALRQAIYYFSGDPRTADQQAEAYARLGKILASQGQSQASAAAQALARQLDPERFAQVEEIAETGPPAALLAPLQASRILGRTTQGGIVRSANRLRQLLDDLGRRVRLTYQVDGAPDGKLHTLEANFVGPAKRQLTHPAWARSATPQAVAAARARRFLAGELVSGTLPLRAELDLASWDDGDGGGNVDLVIDELFRSAPEGTETRAATLRITLAAGDPEGELRIDHRRLEPMRLTLGQGWSHRAEVSPPEDALWLAIVVEDLETGAWGGRLLELP